MVLGCKGERCGWCWGGRCGGVVLRCLERLNNWVGDVCGVWVFQSVMWDLYNYMRINKQQFSFINLISVTVSFNIISKYEIRICVSEASSDNR